MVSGGPRKGPAGAGTPRDLRSRGCHVELAGVESGRCNEGQPAPERLAVRTVPVADPGRLVSRLPEPAALAWIRHGEGLVGWGEAARITLPAGEDRFTASEKWLRELFDRATIEDPVALPGSGPVAFGSFTFDPTCDGSVLVVPSAVLGRRSGRAWLTTIGDPADSLRPACPLIPPAEVRWHDGSLPAPDWEQAVATAVGRIRAPLDQAGLGQAVQQVGHHGPVHAQMLGQGELATDSALSGGGKDLVTPRAARKVGHRIARGLGVRPQDHAQAPSEVACQRADAAWGPANIRATSSVIHPIIIGQKALSARLSV